LQTGGRGGASTTRHLRKRPLGRAAGGVVPCHPPPALPEAARYSEKPSILLPRQFQLGATLGQQGAELELRWFCTLGCVSRGSRRNTSYLSAQDIAKETAGSQILKNQGTLGAKVGNGDKRGREFLILVSSAHCVTLDARRLVELEVVSFAILECCDTSPVVL